MGFVEQAGVMSNYFGKDLRNLLKVKPSKLL